MERDEEERELGDLCAEILENWNTPIFHPEMVHQNPFSTAYDSDNDYDYDVEEVKEQLKFNNSSSSTHSIESKSPIKSCEISSSKRKYEGDKVEKPTKDGSVIPVLVADTFYDKLLGHGTDRIDIATMVKMKGSATCKDGAGANTVSANQPKEIDKPSSGQLSPLFKGNTHMVNRMPKTFITPSYFAHKLRVMLSSNKKRNIHDGFGEKVWRNPGADTAAFFNYGLDEKKWKDYCKEMHALIHEGSSGQSKTDTDTSSSNSIEEGEICEEEPNRGMDEYSSYYSSDVIIGRAEDDSFYQKTPYQTPFKQYKSCRMINGNKMLPEYSRRWGRN